MRWVYTSDQALGTSPIERDRLRMVYYDPFYKYSPVYQATPTGSLGRASRRVLWRSEQGRCQGVGVGEDVFGQIRLRDQTHFLLLRRKKTALAKKNMSAGFVHD